ncbi:MAG: hypothetical protein K2H36_07265 [Clostridia bacterium]|nr:hypothetical protein [Clostridia bacterium]
MKEYDYVEVIVEKEKYAKQGAHKGMRGIILDPRNIDGCWLVVFPDPITLADEIWVPIKEKDLKLIYDSEPVETKIKVMIKNDNYAQDGIYKDMKGLIMDLKSVRRRADCSFSDNKKASIKREDFDVMSQN